MTSRTFATAHLNLKQLILLLAIAFCSNGLFAQLDSASVSLSLTNEVDPSDTTAMVDVLTIETTVNDIDFFGEVVITVYEYNTNYPVSMMKVAKQEFIDEQQVSGNVLITKIYGIDGSMSFRIETSVRNFQGASLPIIYSELIH